MVSSLLYLLQEKMLFLPTVLEQDYAFEFSQPFEELFLNIGAIYLVQSIQRNRKKRLRMIFTGK